MMEEDLMMDGNGMEELWDKGAGTSMVREDSPSNEKAIIYDLEKRTARFGEAVIDFLKQVPLGPRTNRLVDQITGCGTSIGANYCEADDAVSHKEFIKIIGTCRKEARETMFSAHDLPRLSRIGALRPAALAGIA